MVLLALGCESTTKQPRDTVLPRSSAVVVSTSTTTTKGPASADDAAEPTASLAAPEKNGTAIMSEVFEFTKINSFSENPAHGTASWMTDSGKRCWLKDEGPGKADIRFIHRVLAEDHKVVFLSYDSITGQCLFVAPFNSDYVQSIEPVQTPRPGLKVALVLRPSFLFLAADHARFEELAEWLGTAKKHNQLIWVGTFPGDNIILDARIPNRHGAQGSGDRRR